MRGLMMNFGIFVALTLMASTRGQTVPDGSRREGTKGPDIVQAVLDQVLRLNIITAEDELFLCQIAYVESQFGMMDTTYGPGNNGGIWQVGQAAFDAINAPNPPATLTAKLAQIQMAFGVDFADPSGVNLRVPLNSALAAYLYLTTRPGTVPQNLAGRYAYWLANYGSAQIGITQQMFIDFIGLSQCDQATAPTICPANVHMVSPDGTQSVLVTWTPPTNVNIDTGGSTHGGNNNLFISPGKAMKYTYLYTDGQNPGSCSFVISVSAVNGPNVDYCPSNFAIRAEPGQSRRRVSWARPFSPSSTVAEQFTRTNRIPDTEADFAMGDNLVEYDYGQQGVNPSVCAFLVSVLPGVPDTTPPVLTCPPDITVPLVQGQSTIINYKPARAEDNSRGPVALTYSQASGTPFSAVSPTTVIVTGSDSAGNAGTACTFTVTVSVGGTPDTTAPVLTCPADVTHLVDQANQAAVVNYRPSARATAIDNTGVVVPLTYSPPSGSSFNFGPTEVTVTGQDLGGNSGTCTFLVTVANRVASIVDGDILNTGVCGQRVAPGLTNRIVLGAVAQRGSYPWLGSLRSAANVHGCGATLLDSRWAVTAAHCFIPSTPTDPVLTKVVFGDQLISAPSTNPTSGQESTFTTYHHPDYVRLLNNNPSSEFDITLLYLDNPIEFSDYVQPLCLASRTTQEWIDYNSCFAAGWGLLQSMGVSPDELMSVPLPLVSPAVCQVQSTGYTDNIICAGGAAGTGLVADTCQGDSGGPLACRSTVDNFWHLVGVVSSGDGCGTPNSPGFYTRVSRFIPWVRKTIRNNTPRPQPANP